MEALESYLVESLREANMPKEEFDKLTEKAKAEHRRQFRTVERLLYNLDSLKMSIQIRQAKLALIESDEHMLTAVNIERAPSNTNKIISITEEDAIHTVDLTQMMRDRIAKTQKLVEEVEKALSILNEQELKLFDMRYKRQWPWWKIAGEMYMSERHCKRMRNKMIQKLIVVLY